MTKVTNAQLKEIITNNSTTVNNNFKAAKTAIDGKVDKVNGKGLSTNDFTDALQTKLNALPTNAELQSGYVAKESGKGLSTNDFTDALQTKLNALPTNAELQSGYAAKSDIPDSISDLTDDALASYTKASTVAAVGTSDSIATAIGKLEKALDGKQASGSYAASSHNHTVSDITDFPTNVSSFTNDAGYQTASEVASAIAGASHLKRSVVESLPSTSNADANTIYMVLKSPAGDSGNVYNEYMLINNAFELIGDSKVDLTDYALKSELPDSLSDLTDDLMSGYAKASSAAAVGTSDSVAVAIGKLEKALDGKQAAGSYATVGHTHTGADVTMAGYSKAATVAAVGTSDTVNVAIGKVEKALDNKVEAQDVTDTINDIFGDMSITAWANIDITE